jgi:hypothetical protein
LAGLSFSGGSSIQMTKALSGPKAILTVFGIFLLGLGDGFDKHIPIFRSLVEVGSAAFESLLVVDL